MNTQEFKKMLDVVERRTGIKDRNLLLLIPLPVFEAIYLADSRIMTEQRVAHKELLDAAIQIQMAIGSKAGGLWGTCWQLAKATEDYLTAEKEYGLI
jgi:hypothetical protein